jgi:hypothetical protein
MSDTNGTEPRRCQHSSEDDGSPCGAPPQLVRESAAGGLWCLAHDPDPEAQRQQEEARHRGGRTTGRRAAKHPLPIDLGLPDEPSAEHVRRAIVRVTRAHAAGEIGDGRASALRQLLKELREAVELEIDERLEKQARKGRLGVHR